MRQPNLDRGCSGRVRGQNMAGVSGIGWEGAGGGASLGRGVGMQLGLISAGLVHGKEFVLNESKLLFLKVLELGDGRSFSVLHQ